MGRFSANAMMAYPHNESPRELLHVLDFQQQQ
jgi:hypothetical protein